jgi:hypothetical protein
MGEFGLDDWDEVKAAGEWPDVLLGNGASCAVSPTFEYKALFEQAHLMPEDEDLFQHLETVNFEQVLTHLRISSVVCRQLGHAHDEVLLRHERIKQALIAAVNKVHVPWSRAMDNSALLAIRAELPAFEAIFSTNYDVLLYWAMNVGGPHPQLADMFWKSGNTFDAFDAESSRSIVYWLHGGLHLYRNEYGETAKHVSDGIENLLSKLEEGPPIYVAEGTAELKLEQIRSSDYLRYAHHVFGQRKAGLVIVGHSLSAYDQHIVDVVRGRERVAFGVYPQSPEQVAAVCGDIRLRLRGIDLRFFDSKTHPLAHPDLHVYPKPE